MTALHPLDVRSPVHFRAYRLRNVAYDHSTFDHFVQTLYDSITSHLFSFEAIAVELAQEIRSFLMREQVLSFAIWTHAKVLCSACAHEFHKFQTRGTHAASSSELPTEVGRVLPMTLADATQFADDVPRRAQLQYA
jgi:predicted metal-dependent HD superfamily phosphohydrolase